jgi:hypothetical protein
MPSIVTRRTFLFSAALIAAASSVHAQDTPLAMKVYKDPFCGCCNGWIEHLKENGFTVEVDNSRDLKFVHQELGVPDRLLSCHVGTVAGCFIEGHVPATDIKRFLAQRPDARGLALPGMPIGSPGMEVEGQPPEAYDVLLVAKDGTTTVYAHHG